MDKPGKVILIGVVLIAIALPLGFFIKYNFTQRLAKVANQGIDFGLGLDSLSAIDKANEAVGATNQTNQEITQMIENLVGTASSSLETISTNEMISTSTASSSTGF